MDYPHKADPCPTQASHALMPSVHLAMFSVIKIYAVYNQESYSSLHTSVCLKNNLNIYLKLINIKKQDNLNSQIAFEEISLVILNFL